MLQQTKQSVLFTLIFIIISLLFSYFNYDHFSLLSIINSLFIIGMILFLISGFIFVVKSGFFDAITHSFRRFYKTFSRQGQQLGDDLEEMALPSEYRYSIVRPLFFSSCSLLLIMLILLIIYYTTA